MTLQEASLGVACRDIGNLDYKNKDLPLPVSEIWNAEGHWSQPAKMGTATQREFVVSVISQVGSTTQDGALQVLTNFHPLALFNWCRVSGWCTFEMIGHCSSDVTSQCVVQLQMMREKKAKG